MRAHVERPQVLVLDIDQLLRPAERLGVGQRDAAFSPRGIRVAGSTARVGPQELDRAGTGSRRGRRRRRKRRSGAGKAADPVRNHVPGQPRHRCRVLPPFAEALLRLPHHRTPQLQLKIMVSRIGPVHGIGSHALPIATVIGVVAASVVKVDAPDERHIVLGTTAVADDDHLLMVATERKHPLVQQHLTTRPVDREGEHPVRTHLRAHHTGVGVPEQPAHPRSTTGRPGQRLDHRRPALGEELIAIASPPHEVDRVTVTRRGQHARQGLVVHTSMHQRTDRVALGPRPEAGRPLPRSKSERNQSPTDPSRGCPIPRAARTNGNSSSPFGAPTTAAPTPPRTGEDRSIFARSTSNTCRNPITATRSGRRHAKSTNTCGSCPPSSPRSTHRTPGIRSARRSIPASLRTPLPPTTHRGTKLRPVVTSVPDG